MNPQFERIAREIDYVLNTSELRLKRRLQDRLEDEDFPLDDQQLREYIAESSEIELQPLLSFVLTVWEAKGSATRPETDTEPMSPERMAWIVEKLGLEGVREELTARLPKPDPIVIVDEEFTDWYTPERENEHNNYWADYVRVLQRNNWSAESIDTVSDQAREVMRRIEDPTAEHAVSSRGLVVGYVQSGKTANFTAVAAKAIDAGYRLIVVLAGTLDNLRNQTQRRLDKELFGREAVLAGRDPEDFTDKDLKAETYFSGNDEEWERDWRESDEPAFIPHGVRVGTYGFPRIKRLTTSADDYRGKPGANPLELDLPRKELPLHDPENLFNMPCMVAVVKKNAAVLRQFNADLKRAQKTTGNIADLPVLVIDDESDQASINTKNNTKKSDSEEKERTAVNAEITKILQNCPRAQYIGYTATPFANVFVDPSDPEDLYPRHFVLMLNEPPAYRGARWFHDRADFVDEPEKATIENSQSKAFIRDLAEEADFGDDSEFEEARIRELQEALDMFVLTGAIKKFRQEKDSSLKFRHHTMLVHEGVTTTQHKDAVEKLQALWDERGYNLGRPDPELRRLFEEDLLPVMRLEKYNAGMPYPETFEELHPYIAPAYESLMNQAQPGKNTDRVYPILQVDTDAKHVPDFESDRVWKVLVGGAKLSRGYTVEGLTISYFRRRAGGADTLMQTGRWFGFRKGYQDLVRLYAPPTLVEMFEAAMHDENSFRDNIRAYEELDAEGKPRLTPMRLAPLVQQSMPDLKPTAANKMFNAYLVKSASAPEVVDFLSVPEAANREATRENFAQVAIPMLRTLSPQVEEMAYMRVRSKSSDKSSIEYGTSMAYLGLMPADEFVELLDTMRWFEGAAYKENFVNPRIKYLRDLIGRGRHADPTKSDFADVAILLPVSKRALSDAERYSIEVPGVGFQVPLVERSRREGRRDITPTPLPYRYVIRSIASGNLVSDVHPADIAEHAPEHTFVNRFPELEEPELLLQGNPASRGAVVLTLFDDRDRAKVKEMRKDGTYTSPDFEKGEVGVSLAFNSPHRPVIANKGVFEWGVRIPNRDGVDAPITVEISGTAESVTESGQEGM